MILTDIEGLEEFSNYAVDTDGNVWSTKYKKPRIRKPVLNNNYLSVKLLSDYKKMRTFYIHKLIARAFIPTHDVNQRVRHKDGNIENNNVTNLEWVVKNNKKQEEQNFILNDEILERIKQVHLACTKKGIKVGNSYEFTNMMINNALDEYIIRYGLRKVM